MKKNIRLIFSVIIIALCMLITGCKKCGKDSDKYSLKFISDNTVLVEKEVEPNYTLSSSDFPADPEKAGYTFDGWYIETLKISEGYVINSDTEIVAKFTKGTINTDKQDGTKEYPYLISTSEDLVNFGDRINHMDEETENPNYHKSYFKLTNDIDMAGVKFTPIGKEITVEDELGDPSYTIEGFMGSFDGNGFAINNLEVNISMKTNREYYGGLFGVTKHAYIYDLTLNNINYNVESGSDDASRTVAIGGVVGLAKLSTFENIKVTGKINTTIFESNGAYIGGIAGEWYVSDSANSYFAFARNCYTNIETTIGEVEGETCSLESGINGGLFGYVYTYNSTVAIINSTTVGKVYGGKYVGGLVGYSASDNVSILDSSSYATVYATATEVSYTGGLVGIAYGDTIIKDCFYNGPVVRGTRASSPTYESYAGGIVGYSIKDDYEVYYTPGMACVNTYYNTIVRGANNTSNVGVSTENTFNKDFAIETLKWDTNSWEEVDGKLVPTNKDLDETTYKVNLYANGKLVNTVEKTASDGAYEILGLIEDGENLENLIFFNWQVQDGSEYRFYMPVIKDMDIHAKYYDVSEIAGVYTGTGTLHSTIDAGIIVLSSDGSLQWINSSTVGGKYKYNGENIIFEIYNNIGEVSGNFKDGVLEFYVDAGMSGQVFYSFIKSELTFFGEYFSDSGDIITFSGENSMSFQSTLFNNGSYTNGTFTQEGNILTITGSYLESTYSSMTLVDNNDMTFTANFISKNKDVPSLENVKFYKILNKDYSEYNFIGSYNVSYVSSSTSPIQSDYVLKLNSDGTGEYISEFTNTKCEYYVFDNGTKIKLILEGYASEFIYDLELDILHGGLNRGTASAKRSIVLTKTDEGNMKAVVIDGTNNVLFVNDTRSFLVLDGKFNKDANIVINKFEDGEHIFINNEEYILFFNSSEYTSHIGYYALKVGKEVGSYTYNEQSINLDGIGNVTGDINGSYIVYENDFIVIITSDDKFIGFDLNSALNNSNKITKVEATGIQGVWYADSSSAGVAREKYYKLLLDGYGHSAFMYQKLNEETGEVTYLHNWGTDSSWVSVTEKDNVVYCDYNKYQHCEMRFYYNYNLMYSTNFGYMKNIAMHKDGYTGQMVPPTLPSSVVGSYVGENDGAGIVFNLRLDLAGTYCGQPFSAIYDGEDTVIFTLSNVTYKFNIKTFEMLFNDTTVKLTFNGEIEDVIPEALCGVWSGSNWSGMGANESTKVTIEKDGTVKYESQYFSEVTYDYETNTIYASGKSGSQEDISMVITYNTDANTIDVLYQFIYDGEDYTIEGVGLTKK